MARGMVRVSHDLRYVGFYMDPTNQIILGYFTFKYVLVIILSKL